MSRETREVEINRIFDDALNKLKEYRDADHEKIAALDSIEALTAMRKAREDSTLTYRQQQLRAIYAMRCAVVPGATVNEDIDLAGQLTSSSTQIEVDSATEAQLSEIEGAMAAANQDDSDDIARIAEKKALRKMVSSMLSQYKEATAVQVMDEVVTAEFSNVEMGKALECLREFYNKAESVFGGVKQAAGRNLAFIKELDELIQQWKAIGVGHAPLLLVLSTESFIKRLETYDKVNTDVFGVMANAFLTWQEDKSSKKARQHLTEKKAAMLAVPTFKPEQLWVAEEAQGLAYSLLQHEQIHHLNAIKDKAVRIVVLREWACALRDKSVRGKYSDKDALQAIYKLLNTVRGLDAPTLDEADIAGILQATLPSDDKSHPEYQQWCQALADDSLALRGAQFESLAQAIDAVSFEATSEASSAPMGGAGGEDNMGRDHRTPSTEVGDAASLSRGRTPSTQGAASSVTASTPPTPERASDTPEEMGKEPKEAKEIIQKVLHLKSVSVQLRALKDAIETPDLEQETLKERLDAVMEKMQREPDDALHFEVATEKFREVATKAREDIQVYLAEILMHTVNAADFNDTRQLDMIKSVINTMNKMPQAFAHCKPVCLLKLYVNPVLGEQMSRLSGEAQAELKKAIYDTKAYDDACYSLIGAGGDMTANLVALKARMEKDGVWDASVAEQHLRFAGRGTKASGGKTHRVTLMADIMVATKVADDFNRVMRSLTVDSYLADEQIAEVKAVVSALKLQPGALAQCEPALLLKMYCHPALTDEAHSIKEASAAIKKAACDINAFDELCCAMVGSRAEGAVEKLAALKVRMQKDALWWDDVEGKHHMRADGKYVEDSAWNIRGSLMAEIMVVDQDNEAAKNNVAKAPCNTVVDAKKTELAERERVKAEAAEKENASGSAMSSNLDALSPEQIAAVAADAAAELEGWGSRSGAADGEAVKAIETEFFPAASARADGSTPAAGGAGRSTSRSGESAHTNAGLFGSKDRSVAAGSQGEPEERPRFVSATEVRKGVDEAAGSEKGRGPRGSGAST